ncbi:MAG: hypothetical protein CMG88_13605, partial [Marinobacter sp.]|nr:hypothetical protein [Marinobacter sp.]
NPVVDVPLTGTSVLAPVPEISVTPADVSFGSVMLGETATAQVTIANEGNASLMINSIEIAGTNSSNFTQTNDCTTVVQDGSCTVEISFMPSAAGGRSATLNIASDDPEMPGVTVALSGQGNDGSDDVLEVLLDLEGQTDIKASGSSLPLSGSIATQLELATGMFEADLALAPTQGQFKIPLLFKSLTANAKVTFEQADVTTGTLINGNLTANSSLYVEVPKVTVRLFGLKIPVGGGKDCRTADPVNIELASVEGTNFSLSEGGDVTGNYTLPPLQNCGPLTDVLNQFLAGPDNGIDLTLTPNL